MPSAAYPQTLSSASKPRLPVTGLAFGESRTFARDFAYVGGITGTLAPLAVGAGFSLLPASYYALTGLGGLLAGGLIGALLPWLLGARVRRLPVLALLLLGPAVGLLWGGLAGLLGAISLQNHPIELGLLSAGLGAIAGAVQFGWLWLPYSIKRARKKRTWPLLAAASVIAPALGWAALALGGLLF